MPDPKRIDTHFHAAVLGKDPAFQKWGRISDKLQQGLTYEVILLYVRLKKSNVSDQALHEATLRVIDESTMDHVVVLALDPVYDPQGVRHEAQSNVWVDNDYVLELQKELGDKVLLGASVHPYDPNFKDRVKKYVDKGAVLLKWIPSSQQINLAEPRMREALVFLATAGADGGPLPVLMHVGPEYAIPSTDERTKSYDFLRWRWRDRFFNSLKKKEKRLYTPRVAEVNANLQAGLDAGASYIFAHCGLPYYAPNFFIKFLEHSDFKPMRDYLRRNPSTPGMAGKCYTDVSACVTPFRRSYFRDIRKLPRQYVFVGSDWPVPVFELSANLKENARDFAAVIRGDLGRVFVPQDNLLDVNWRELEHAFGKDHPMFTNGTALLPAHLR